MLRCREFALYDAVLVHLMLVMCAWRADLVEGYLRYCPKEVMLGYLYPVPQKPSV